jgi:ubiquinone/menaquinone biosynthesis C-methylase UbiE
MSSNASPNRFLQLSAFLTAGIFIIGELFTPVGAWTGAVICAWFVGTQKPGRGLLWLLALVLIPELLSNWHATPPTPAARVLWIAAIAILTVLPYALYRLTSMGRQSFLSTLALPFWGVFFQTSAQQWAPHGVFDSLAETQSAHFPLARVAAVLGPIPITFLIYWFAAVVVWMWAREFRTRKIAAGAGAFVAVCALVFVYVYSPWVDHATATGVIAAGPELSWSCLVAGLILGAWRLIRSGRQHRGWAERTETVALLRSPYTGEALRVAGIHAHEALVSQSGERFPIRCGIPALIEADKLTGFNRKYRQLYQAIGGFYDDFQRVVCAFRGIDRDQYVMSYLRSLEVERGDLVLETSVGTGLNYKYLPPGVKLFGLDCSAAMLANCQANLSRWDIEAELFLGNAEDLPFANDSFDVVFHVGGINFFNDRAKAIREMIRVAKPGSRILIADETEKHVKAAYERIPITNRFFKNRREAVTAPVDLVPPEMGEIRLELLRDGRFYALTFRKPLCDLRSLANL